MTATQILNYLSRTHIPDGLAKFIRITTRSGFIYIGHFRKEDQREELIKNNKWIFIQGGSDSYIEINGNDITSIRLN
jgi:hypothetical protein